MRKRAAPWNSSYSAAWQLSPLTHTCHYTLLLFLGSSLSLRCLILPRLSLVLSSEKGRKRLHVARDEVKSQTPLSATPCARFCPPESSRLPSSPSLALRKSRPERSRCCNTVCLCRVVGCFGFSASLTPLFIDIQTQHAIFSLPCASCEAAQADLVCSPAAYAAPSLAILRTFYHCSILVRLLPS